MAEPATIRILIVEDHTIVRDGMKTILSNEAGLQVIGEAGSSEEALAILQQGTLPDVVLTDVNMPGLSGLELSERLKEEFPELRVIVLTMIDDDTSIRKAFDAGASGYLLKTIGRQELAFAIRHVHNGNKYISSELVYQLVMSREQGSASRGTRIELSTREMEVLKLVAEGMTNIQIADKLFTSRRTVEGHRQKLMHKTKTQNSASLIRYAIEHRLLSDD